ncbi:MAG: DUF1643 domain-containing protein [Oscillospiraceae bacterium]
MLEEATVIRNKAIFSDDKKHRLLLHREWDNEKPSAMIIMINPNSADNLSMDMTTMLVVNNLNRLDFGSVDIVNLYTRITPKIHFRFYSDEDLLHPDNDTMILESAEKADKIIIGWGTVGKHNQRIRERENTVLEMLKPYKDKLFQIGENGCHPLTPTVRNEWVLEPFEMEGIEND